MRTPWLRSGRYGWQCRQIDREDSNKEATSRSARRRLRNAPCARCGQRGRTIWDCGVGDVICAFLRGRFFRPDEDSVYLESPKLAKKILPDVFTHRFRFVRLAKSLYGLKDAPLEWEKFLVEKLLAYAICAQGQPTRATVLPITSPARGAPRTNSNKEPKVSKTSRIRLNLDFYSA
jgi:hypothetical protein